MHYYTRTDRDFIEFGEINFEESTQNEIIMKTGINIFFMDDGENPWVQLNSNCKNDFTVLKNEGLFNVLEDFCWSGSYEETLEDLIKCLKFWEFEELDPETLNTEKVNVNVEE